MALNLAVRDTFSGGVELTEGFIRMDPCLRKVRVIAKGMRTCYLDLI